MGERRDYPERQSSLPEWTSLEAEFAEIEADLFPKGRIRGRWHGDMSAATVLTTVAIVAALFTGIGDALVPTFFVLGLGSILWMRKQNNGYKRPSAAQLGREPPSEGTNREITVDAR